MKAIPSSFWFMGMQWKVRYLSMEGQLGRTDFGQQIISLDPAQSKQSLKQTFVHEFLHVVVNSMGLDRSVNLSQEAEEAIVNTMANGIYAGLVNGII